jgi:hypothetical protein
MSRIREWTKTDRFVLVCLSLMTLAIAMCFGGCGSSRENARLQLMSLHGVEAQGAQLREMRDGIREATPEALNDVMRMSTVLLESLGAVFDHLAVGLSADDLAVPTTAQMAYEAPGVWQEAVATQIPVAREETENRAWWRGMWGTMGTWLSTALSSWFGITLGGGGVLAAVGGIAAKVIAGRKKIAAMLRQATEFGETAKQYLSHPMVPEEVRGAWDSAQGVLARAQDLTGVREPLRKYRPKDGEIVSRVAAGTGVVAGTAD